MRKKLDKDKIINKDKEFKDSDGDGLSDYDEINIYGSDPYDDDTDDDGIEDGEAILNGKHPVTGENLKDYFIPHKGNDYKPKALHHKRLLFHVGTVLLVKVIILILVFFYPITAWMTPDISIAQSKKVITLTNNIRSNQGLGLLEENSKLNQAAVKKVEDMFINQYFAHVSPQGLGLKDFVNSTSYNYIVIGENLAIGFESASEVVEAWKNSPTHYNNLVDPNFKEIGVALTSGVYKQENTFLTAQYFGLSPDFSSSTSTAEDEDNKTIDEDEEVDEKEEIINEADRAVKSEVVEADSDTETKEENIKENNETEVVSNEQEEVIEGGSTEDNTVDSEVNVATNVNLEKDSNSTTNTTTTNTTSTTQTLTSVELITEGDVQSDLSKYEAKITIDEPNGIKKDKIVKVEAYLPVETVSARLEIFNNNIEMTAVAGDDVNKDGYKKWVGQAVVQDDSDSIAPPIITLYSDTGKVEKVGVTDNNIKPRETSVLSQYTLFKNNPNRELQKIFNVSSIYFKILLSLAIIAMMLNIFIAIKKQRLKVIISGIGFILFLLFMIII